MKRSSPAGSSSETCSGSLHRPSRSFQSGQSSSHERSRFVPLEKKKLEDKPTYSAHHSSFLRPVSSVLRRSWHVKERGGVVISLSTALSFCNGRGCKQRRGGRRSVVNVVSRQHLRGAALSLCGGFVFLFLHSCFTHSIALRCTVAKFFKLVQT